MSNSAAPYLVERLKFARELFDAGLSPLEVIERFEWMGLTHDNAKVLVHQAHGERREELWRAIFASLKGCGFWGPTNDQPHELTLDDVHLHLSLAWYCPEDEYPDIGVLYFTVEINGVENRVPCELEVTCKTEASKVVAVILKYVTKRRKRAAKAV